jgi:hypothetical protein
MAGLQKCKVKHFAQPRKDVEGQVESPHEFRQWAESRHWRKPPGCRQGAGSGLKRLTFQRLFQMAVWIISQPSAPAQSTRLDTLQPLVSREPDGVPAGAPARHGGSAKHPVGAPRRRHRAGCEPSILSGRQRHFRQIEWVGSDTLNTETALWAKRFEGPFPGVTIVIEGIGPVVMRSSQNEGDERCRQYRHCLALDAQLSPALVRRNSTTARHTQPQ